jgi:hypothetical protein
VQLTPETVRAERDRLHDDAPTVVATINETRDLLGDRFDTDVAHVAVEQYHAELDAVFADGDRAVNVAALVRLLREVDVVDDYPGFVVDEQLGRLLASTIAGDQPLATLAEATFHVADTEVHSVPEVEAGGDTVATEEADDTAATEEADDTTTDEETAGVDDLVAALAAGFQTRLPGWTWTETESPFTVEEGGW